jgi:hypothetical protein
MIDITSTLAAAEAWLRALSGGIDSTIEDAVTATLDEIVRDLIPVTPVKTGRMRDSYTIAHGGRDVWELLNTAESPTGYHYPHRVLDDPTWSRQYGALNRVLDAGEDALGTHLAIAVTRLVGRP